MKRKSILITGGCGFIGCNTAARLAAMGHVVTIYDDLSRPLTELNLQWLRDRAKIEFVRGDVRDRANLFNAVKVGRFDAVVHLAAQVAVTTSVANPLHDFEVNAAGTLNVLEAIRQFSPHSVILYSSTNKVYGKLAGVAVQEMERRYVTPALAGGVSENHPLDFHSPYGCSKGCADQYVVDYARIFGLRTVCLRQSCIYGQRQFGVEDQGWVAWFTIAHTLGKEVTIYGNGKQVRDVLFVEDLVDCYLACMDRIDSVSGQTFNIGGGPANSLSLLEFVDLLGQLAGSRLKYSFADWRPGDQPVYISDITKAASLLGWKPRTDARAGIARLIEWVVENRRVFGVAAKR